MQPKDDADLVLHIGGAKCGSSAIQAYLAQNSATLAKCGIGVPGTGLDFESDVTGEQIWMFENAATHGLHGAALGDKLARLYECAAERELPRLVVSAENICNHPALARVVAEATQGRSVRIIFYVRRQDDFLISSWQQWHLKLYDTVEAFLADRVGKLGCWMSMIDPWADAFGDAAITVRPFTRDRLKAGDVVADFCDCAGISQDGLSPLNRAANPSFDEALARLAHRVQDVFEDQHDNRFYEVMVRLLGPAALKSDPGSSLLDLDTRRRIVGRYDEENEALKARFLPEFGDAPLFQQPMPKDVRTVSEAAAISQDIAMLTRAVFALADRADPIARKAQSGQAK
ncbi:hypothetical protein N9C96_02005 [bacterium]|nr:hypothetical protein [bacterium]